MRIPSIDEITYCPVHLIKEEVNRMQQGQFNALDYNIDPTGGVACQNAINDAIIDANAFGTMVGMGGVVNIPAGRYLINDPIYLLSNITVNIDPNAWFYIPAAYAGDIFAIDGTPLVRCFLQGGYFYGDTRTWNFLNLISPDNANYVMECVFRDMLIYNPDTAIRLETQTNGYINGNLFRNLWVNRPVCGLYTLQGVGTLGLDANMFDNLTIQAHADTAWGIRDLSGDYNMFHNLMLWDWGVTGAGSVTCNLLNTSYHNFIQGFGIKAKNFSDAGLYNVIFDTDSIDFRDNVYVKGAYADRAVINKFNVYGNTVDGTLAAPAGDIGIRIKSGGTAALTDSDNRSVRVACRNMANTNNAGVMVLQAYNGAAWVDVLILNHLGQLKSLLSGVPAYANNAAAIAGGLAVGNFYRTGGDPDSLCIVH